MLSCLLLNQPAAVIVGERWGSSLISACRRSTTTRLREGGARWGSSLNFACLFPHLWRRRLGCDRACRRNGTPWSPLKAWV